MFTLNCKVTRAKFANHSTIIPQFINHIRVDWRAAAAPVYDDRPDKRLFDGGGSKSISKIAILLCLDAPQQEFPPRNGEAHFAAGKVCVSFSVPGDTVMRIESRLTELGITLPPTPAPGGVYTPILVVDHMAYVSGQVPYGPDGKLIIGRIGSDMTEEQGTAAARAVALTMLATIKASLGNLDRVKRIVKVLGFVNCTPDFQKHPAVMNGFSTTMVEVFGDAGKAARSAVGMGSLPFNVPVEVEALLELHP